MLTTSCTASALTRTAGSEDLPCADHAFAAEKHAAVEPSACDHTSETALSSGELAPDEQVAFQAELWKLLAKRTALYTMGESSSVPESTARRLLDSVCFVLGIDPADPDPALVRALLAGGLGESFAERLKGVEQKANRIDELWEQVALSTPLLESTALKDTLESLHEFRARYDYRSFAHEIPCDIDYPLACPVPETVLGVDYVIEYLERLLVENDFMQRFELDRCKALLRRVHPEYRELIINLYEPIATNAIGLALAGGDVQALRVDDADRTHIAEAVAESSGSALCALLEESASAVCDALEIESKRTRGYLARTALDLRPRLARFAGRHLARSGEELTGRRGNAADEGLAGVFLDF